MYFCIVSPSDAPLYECDFSKDASQLQQFIVHSSLDLIDEIAPTSTTAYLKAVDRFNEFIVSCYLCASGARMCLLHEGRNDDGIRNFFNEVYELFVKILANPFYQFLKNEPVRSPLFDAKVRALAKKHLQA